MSRLRSAAQSWTQDRLLRRVVRNSTYLFASNVISAILSIVTANLLGVAVFGTLGIVTGFVSNINRLLSFRMGDVVVKYMGEALARGEKERAGAVVRLAALVETATSLLAFGALVLLAPLGARFFAKDAALEPLFLIFGLSILANIAAETATGVLQVTNHFRSQALINLAQSVLVAALVALAAARGASLQSVLLAYLAGKVVMGLAPVFVALYWLPRTLGAGWWRADLRLLPPWRELTRFAISTNFSGTINVFARDSEVQWVGFFFDNTVAGYYKTALALVNLVVMPINPFIGTTYPEITRAIASRQWARLRKLLRRVTLIAAGWTAAVAIGLLLFGRQVLFSDWTLFGRTFHIYSGSFLPAFDVLMVILIGYGAANILFWNRPLLLAQGLAGDALRVSFWSMLAKVALALILLPGAGYIMEAWLLTGYFLLSVGIMVWRGLNSAAKTEAKEAGTESGQ
ncbi:MAG: oligosaccharide flippase family protein [Chloroflexi bacterium]|nr:oligosaccharide flippase family protein [Chloroflexota bacterium]